MILRNAVPESGRATGDETCEYRGRHQSPAHTMTRNNLLTFNGKAEPQTQRTRSRMPGIFSTIGSQDYMANRLLQRCCANRRQTHESHNILFRRVYQAGGDIDHSTQACDANEGPTLTSQKVRRLVWGILVLQVRCEFFRETARGKDLRVGRPGRRRPGLHNWGQCPSMWLNEFIKFRVLLVMMELCTCRLLLIACWRR